jgi:hypothetical protein
MQSTSPYEYDGSKNILLPKPDCFCFDQNHPKGNVFENNLELVPNTPHKRLETP